jgi:hypothetical protein
MHRTRIAALVVPAACVAALIATPASASVTGPFSGYATGTFLHTDAVQAGITGPRLADVEEGFAGTAVSSSGLAGPAILNEMDQAVKPAAAGGKSYASASAAEVGIATTTPNDPNGNQLKLPPTATKASAPPSTAMVTNDLVKVPANPLLYADAFRAQSQALWNDDACILGQPLNFAMSHAADVQLLSTVAQNAADGKLTAPLLATDANPNGRAIGESRSFSYLTSNGDGTFGLASETHQTFLPVTLLKGTANELTVEVLGEWVLRVVATGVPGKSRVEYAPAGRVSPSTPILRILQRTTLGLTDTKILDFQDLFGVGKLPIPLLNLPGVLEISIGENPRAIGGAVNSAPDVNGNGTHAAAAVDVVRVKLLESKNILGQVTSRIADFRLGHMEASATVPAGGIHCTIPVSKTVDKNPVGPGETFTWTITVPSTSGALAGLACDLIGLRVDDVVSVVDGAPSIVLTGADHGGAITGNNKVSWPNLGTYHPGDPPIVLHITGLVDGTTGAGTLRDDVTATANLGNCTGGAAGDQMVGTASLTNTTMSGTVALTAPRTIGVLAARETNPNTTLPATGRPLAQEVAIAFVLIVLGGIVLLTSRRPLLTR